MKGIYGLIGRRLGHSLSAEIFNNKFGIEHIDAEYCLFEIPSIEGIRTFLSRIPNLKGINVTVPYKEEIFPYLDYISPEAQSIGAVNVVRVERNSEGQMILGGYNSDVYGFTESIRPILREDIKKALILGTGGASKAVEAGLRSLNIDTTLVSRNPPKTNNDNINREIINYRALTAQTISETLLIVNTTPLGMWPNIDSSPDIPYEVLTRDHICYDVVYNPAMTLFMRKSAQQGAVTVNGLQMLHLQAVRAWEIWTQDPIS